MNKRIYWMVGFLFWFSIANSQQASLKPVIGSSITDTTFWIDVKVGDPNAITGLYGISFRLKSNKATCTYIDGSGVVGGFLGSTGVLPFFYKVDDQTVDIGVSRTSSPGITGAGIIARAQFKSRTPGEVVFSLQDVLANDSNGDPIPLELGVTSVILKPGYQLMLKNDVQVDNMVYEFDVMLHRIGGIKFELSDIEPILTFNTGISTGILTFSIIDGTSELNVVQHPTSLLMNGNELRIAPQALPGIGNGTIIPSYPGLRIGRFRLTSNVAFSAQSANLQWKNAPSLSPNTKVSVYIDGASVEITDADQHLSDLMNPTLPITLSSFTRKFITDKRDIVLEWITQTEVNNYGFTVQRRSINNSEFIEISNSFIQGHGTSAVPQTYSYADQSLLPPGRYVYRLKSISTDGSFSYSGELELEIEGTLPTSFALMQNCPNPFNPVTQIQYSLPKNGFATLKIYDVLGKEVETLIHGEIAAGVHTQTWNAARYTSGIYMYRLTFGSMVATKKLILLK